MTPSSFPRYGIKIERGPFELKKVEAHCQRYEYVGTDPEHKDEVIFLAGYTMSRDASVGDRGTMKYITTPSSGLWYFFKEQEQ